MKAVPPLYLIAAGLLAAAGLGLGQGTVQAGPVSTQLFLSGGVQNPGTYDLSALQSLPPTTQTVSFTSGSGPQTHTFTGTRLWGLIESAGIMIDPTIKGDINRKYVTATATDGYRAVFALGELNPDFGNQPSLVAYAEEIAGTVQPLGVDGFARTTVPGDGKGGRYVSNLVSLDLRGSASQQTGIGGGVSSAFTVSGLVNSQPVTLNTAALANLGLTPRTQTVGTDTYGGYGLWDLLNTLGIAADPAIKNDILSLYVVATGSDGYQALFSMGELDPAFGNQPDLLALTLNGGDLSTSGFARLVVPNDVRRGRWVSNLVALEVFRAAPVPAPGTWALLLLGLGLALPWWWLRRWNGSLA